MNLAEISEVGPLGHVERIGELELDGGVAVLLGLEADGPEGADPRVALGQLPLPDQLVLHRVLPPALRPEREVVNAVLATLIGELAGTILQDIQAALASLRSWRG